MLGSLQPNVANSKSQPLHLCMGHRVAEAVAAASAASLMV